MQKLFLSLLLISVIAGCSHEPKRHGKYIPPYLIQQIKSQPYHKSDIQEILGTPNVIGGENNHIWYYISQVSRKRIMLTPAIEENFVFALYFNQQDYIEKTQIYTNKDAHAITPHADETPTKGHDMSLIDSLLQYTKRPVEQKAGGQKK